MKINIEDRKVTITFDDGTEKTISMEDAQEISRAIDVYYGIEDVETFLENDTNSDDETWEDACTDIIENDDFIQEVADKYISIRHEYAGDNECRMGWRDALEMAFKEIVSDYPQYKGWWDKYAH